MASVVGVEYMSKEAAPAVCRCETGYGLVSVVCHTAAQSLTAWDGLDMLQCAGPARLLGHCECEIPFPPATLTPARRWWFAKSPNVRMLTLGLEGRRGCATYAQVLTQ